MALKHLEVNGRHVAAYISPNGASFYIENREALREREIWTEIGSFRFRTGIVKNAGGKIIDRQPIGGYPPDNLQLAAHAVVEHYWPTKKD